MKIIWELGDQVRIKPQFTDLIAYEVTNPRTEGGYIEIKPVFTGSLLVKDCEIEEAK
jgi:hypothetical protein